MSNSASKILALVKDLLNKGKIEEAIQLVDNIEPKKNLTLEETLKILGYKSKLYLYLGEFDNGFKFAEELYQKSVEMEAPLFSLDALLIKCRGFFYQRKLKEWYETFDQYETLFNSIPRDESLEYRERKAGFLFMKGGVCFYKGKLDRALDYCSKSLKLFEEVDPHSYFKFYILAIMAYPYNNKGELNLALECNKKALTLIPKNFPENFFLFTIKSLIYRSMGFIYAQKGDLDKALEYLLLHLEILKRFDLIQFIGSDYVYIIEVLLAQKNVSQAQEYLQELEHLYKKYKTRQNKEWLQYARALILQLSSPRMRDRAEAENIYKKLIQEDSGKKIDAAVNLCVLYFEEFQQSNHMGILDDIQPLIDQLQINVRESNSFSLLALVKLLKAKLALIQINMVEARKLLTEAQQIAEEHDLQRLAGEISREHDHLLEELKLWESFKREKASVSERLELASIDGVMERLQGKRAIEVPEVSIEEPILLLIMDKSGATYFNHSFVGDWDFDDLFSSFMSAFNTFTGEIFSKSIDRVKVGENTILINPIEPYLACYVIKGQSYPAQQKLTRFSDAIKASPEIWKALNRAAKTSEMLELDNPPSLGSVVNEIFV